MKQLKQLAHSELKFFMQSENDLKEMTTSKVLQLISLFLNEVLEIYPRAEETLVDNFDAGLFTFGALTFEFKNLEETLRVTNSNLVFYHSLSMLCQHLSFDLEYLLWPQRYEKEWRQILCLMIDFARYKAQYAERHLELVAESQNNQNILTDMTI